VTGVYQQPLGYYADAQPISIGLGSQALAIRAISGFKTKSGYYASAYAGRVWRRDVMIDRNYYYTDRPFYTNRVDMPHMYDIGIRLVSKNQDFASKPAMLYHSPMAELTLGLISRCFSTTTTIWVL
jgi:hypothetical protein